MTKHEAAVISLFTGILIGDFSDMHKYAEKLNGEPIMTHQFANTNFVESLKEKCKPDFMAIHDAIEE